MKYITLFLLALVGCTSPVKKETLSFGIPIYVEEAPHLLKPGEHAQARLQYKGDVLVACRVILKQYPKCLLHEVRHCVEGNWHEGHESSQDC